MSNLRTLKDFDWIKGDLTTIAQEDIIEELKAEAVKHIKDLTDTSIRPKVNNGLVLWIMDFFNLTKQGIKELEELK